MKDISGEPRVRFRCPGCGKCCKAPPSVSIDELLIQADNFILGGRLSIISAIDVNDANVQEILSHDYPEIAIDNPEVREEMAAHINKIAERQGVRVSQSSSTGSSAYLSFSLVDLDQASGSCPQLGEDGMCKIYQTRPRRCRILPVDEIIPECLLGDFLVKKIEHLISLDGKCDISPQAPIIWEQGRLTDKEERERHATAGINLSQDAGDTSKEVIQEYLVFKVAEIELESDHTEDVVEYLRLDQMDPVFALVPAVTCLARMGKITSKQAAEVLLKQASLIEHRLPNVVPSQPVEGVLNSDMRSVLMDWKRMYEHVGHAWLDRPVNPDS